MDPLVAPPRLPIPGVSARRRSSAARALAGLVLALWCCGGEAPEKPSPWTAWRRRTPAPRPLTTVEITAADLGSNLRYFVFFRSAENGGPPVGWGLWQADEAGAVLDFLNARDGVPAASWRVMKATGPEGVALLLNGGSASGGPIAEPEIVATARGMVVTYTVFYRSAVPSATNDRWRWWQGWDPQGALEVLNAPAPHGEGAAEVEVSYARPRQAPEYTVFYRSGAAASGGWKVGSAASAGAARFLLYGSDTLAGAIEAAALTSIDRGVITILYRR